MKTFFDTSALVKRYIEEGGTDIVEALCLETDELFISSLCPPEAISVFCRLKRENKINEDEYVFLKESLFKDIEDANVITISPKVVSFAVSVLEKSPVRGMDAIHIGCAMMLQPEILFVSSDSKQISAAENIGLEVSKV